MTATPTASQPAAAEPDEESATFRTTLRLPERLKSRVEQAAATEGVSVNSWLVRAVTTALEPRQSSNRPENRRPVHRLGPLSPLHPGSRRRRGRSVLPAGERRNRHARLRAPSGPIELDVEVGVGHVEVVAEDRADVGVEVLPSNARKAGDRSLAEERSSTSTDARPRRGAAPDEPVRPDRLRRRPRRAADGVGGRHRQRLRGGPAARHVRAHPRARQVRHRAASTRVGDLDLFAPYGEADVREVAGRLDLDAGHGRVRIGSVAGEARIRASHGSVDLGVTHGPSTPDCPARSRSRRRSPTSPRGAPTASCGSVRRPRARSGWRTATPTSRSASRPGRRRGSTPPPRTAWSATS